MESAAEPSSQAVFERLRSRIPATVRFGTSTWNYPGWQGLVYHQDYGPKGAAARMLKEYAAFPLFGTVGIDSSYYGPPTEAVLTSYAEHLPPGFPCISKVWSQLTIHTFTKAQDPDRAGKRNPDFLTPMYFAVLREHGVAHVFNSWTRMPPIGHQLDLPNAITGPFILARALLRPGRTYNEAVDAFAPYDRIREPNPKLRRDLVRLVETAVKTKIPAYLLVNNRAEGSAPLTIAAVAELLKPEV